MEEAEGPKYVKLFGMNLEEFSVGEVGFGKDQRGRWRGKREEEREKRDDV